MENLRNTRVIILSLDKYITGKTLDYGAGNAKYKNLITPHASEYLTFDMVPGEQIDIVGDAHQTPFTDNSFDTIVSTQLLEHVEKPWVVVSEMRRILKPGGFCIITAPFLVPYHADPYDFFRYTREGLVKLFENEGFKIELSGSYGKTPLVLAEMIHFSLFSPYHHQSKKRKKWEGRIMRLIKSLADKLNRLFKDRVIYANAYLVAKKPGN